jgi:hypothetical protein
MHTLIFELFGGSNLGNAVRSDTTRRDCYLLLMSKYPVFSPAYIIRGECTLTYYTGARLHSAEYINRGFALVHDARVWSLIGLSWVWKGVQYAGFVVHP